jgi:AraC-like DNA-binding protein
MLLILSIFLLLTSLILIGYNWRSHPQTILIALIFIIYALYSLLYYFTIASKNDFWYALMFGNLTPLWYLPGPLLYFYYRSTLRNTQIFTSWKDALHYIPSTIQFFTMFPYYVIPFAEKLQIAHSIHENPDLIQQIASRFTLYSVAFDFASRPLFIFLYIIACYWLLIKYSASSNNHRYTLRWLRAFLFLLFMENVIYAISLYLLINQSFGFTYGIVHLMHNITGATFFMVPLILLCFFPQILYGSLKSKSLVAKILTTPAPDHSFVELSNRIITYMQEEQMFLNPDLEISDISIALKVPRHHIAYCFTNVLQSKFTTYKNKLRIAFAQNLLENGEAQLSSIDGIGAKSGFKSRSAFYEAFKVETGMTPNQFLKNQSADKQL